MGNVWNVGYIVKDKAGTMPENNAFIFEDVPVTYKELNEQVNRIAHFFQSLGMKKGDRVALYLMNCPEYIYTFFAGAKIGLIIVPLNFRLVGAELAYQLNNSGARLLLFHARFSETVRKIMDQIPVDKDKYIYLPGRDPEAPACPAWATPFHDQVKEYPCTEPVLQEHIYLEDPLGIIYTSGVTGAPKGAVVSHNQTFYKIMSLSPTGAPNLIFLTQLPLFHSGGLFISLASCIGLGRTMVFRQNFDPAQFCLDIEKYKVNIVFALTTMWRLILDSGKLDEVDHSSLIMSIGGGERTPKALLDKLKEKGIIMSVGFGQTENSAMMVLPPADIDRKPGSVGKPREWTDIWIEDEQGNKLPPGQIGEIVAIGPKVMSGYWNNPEATAKAIVNGVLHTGDLGYMDEEGYFWVVDRAKDMYRSGGENIYPAEIEKILYEHPKVQNVAIIGVADEKWGETGKAFIETVNNQSITLEEVQAFLKDKVSRYKFPSSIEIIAELPMTATGKIKKSELKEKYGVRLDK